MHLLYQQEGDRLLALLFVMQLNQLILFLAYRQIEHQTIQMSNLLIMYNVIEHKIYLLVYAPIEFYW